MSLTENHLLKVSGFDQSTANELRGELDQEVPVTQMPAFTGDVTTTSGSVATTITAGIVSNDKLATMAAGTLKGNVTGLTAAPADLSAAQGRTLLGLAAVASSGSATDLSAGTLPAARFPALTGDVTTSAGSVAASIAAAAVTNAKLATVAALSVKGNNTVGVAAPIDMTVAQTKAMLAITTGDVTGLAAVAASGSATDLSAGTVPVARMPALTGDVTTSAGAVATSLAAAAVTNAKLANMAANTIKGNNTGGSTVPIDLSLAQATAMLNAFTTTLQGVVPASSAAGNILRGDATWSTITQLTAALNAFTTSLQGLVPASGGGTANFLRADATWAAPGGGASQLVGAGDGHDGTVSLTGTITMTRNMFWSTGTVAAGGCTVLTSGFVATFQVLDATLGTVVFHEDGDAASGNTGATGISNVGTLTVSSGTGGSGNFNNGTSGSAPAAGTWPTSFRAGLGGAGGNGTAGKTGGSVGSAPTLSADATGSINDFFHWLNGQPNLGTSSRVCGGCGGSSGGGSGAASAGGGGAGGGNCVVVCGSVLIPGNVTVRANGGAGGAGATACGGGGGGGGGYAGIALMTGSPATITVQANGGAAGASGGGGAVAGSAGSNGQVLRFGG